MFYYNLKRFCWRNRYYLFKLMKYSSQTFNEGKHFNTSVVNTSGLLLAARLCAWMTAEKNKNCSSGFLQRKLGKETSAACCQCMMPLDSRSSLETFLQHFSYFHFLISPIPSCLVSQHNTYSFCFYFCIWKGRCTIIYHQCPL